jgi:hypothetical protein
MCLYYYFYLKFTNTLKQLYNKIIYCILVYKKKKEILLIILNLKYILILLLV